MITWTFKGALAAVLLFSLIACEGGQGGGALKGFGGGAAKTVALPHTQMANGAFTLVAPQGFCIDKRSLKQRFAIMARCDTLGVPDGAAGAPIGILTVSVTAAKEGQTLPTPEHTANAAKLARTSAQMTETDGVSFRAEGMPPIKGLDVAHWRATAQIGDQVLGIALYGPKNGRAVSVEGRAVINNLIRRSREQS